MGHPPPPGFYSRGVIPKTGVLQPGEGSGVRLNRLCFALHAGSLARLKNGYAQDDALEGA